MTTFTQARWDERARRSLLAGLNEQAGLELCLLGSFLWAESSLLAALPEQHEHYSTKMQRGHRVRVLSRAPVHDISWELMPNRPQKWAVLSREGESNNGFRVEILGSGIRRCNQKCQEIFRELPWTPQCARLDIFELEIKYQNLSLWGLPQPTCSHRSSLHD